MGNTHVPSQNNPPLDRWLMLPELSLSQEKQPRKHPLHVFPSLGFSGTFLPLRKPEQSSLAIVHLVGEARKGFHAYSCSGFGSNRPNVTGLAGREPPKAGCCYLGELRSPAHQQKGPCAPLPGCPEPSVQAAVVLIFQWHPLQRAEGRRWDRGLCVWQWPLLSTVQTPKK